MKTGLYSVFFLFHSFTALKASFPVDIHMDILSMFWKALVSFMHPDVLLNDLFLFHPLYLLCVLSTPGSSPKKPYKFAIIAVLWSQAEDLVPIISNTASIHFKKFKLCEPQLPIHRLEVIITICNN